MHIIIWATTSKLESILGKNSRTDGCNGYKVPILRHTHKTVQFSVQTATIKRVPYLSKHKRVRVENKDSDDQVRRLTVLSCQQ